MENLAIEHLMDRIERKRSELNKLIERSYIISHSLIDIDVIKKSEELDILLVQYYKKAEA